MVVYTLKNALKVSHSTNVELFICPLKSTYVSRVFIGCNLVALSQAFSEAGCFRYTVPLNAAYFMVLSKHQGFKYKLYWIFSYI